MSPKCISVGFTISKISVQVHARFVLDRFVQHTIYLLASFSAAMGPKAMMKRRMQQAEHPESPSYPEAKRQKRDLADDTNEGSRVGATELASAFALASLATFSPKSVNMRQPAETREGVVSHTSWEERAPKDEPAPISPETRAPSPYSKRVHFAPGVKEVSRQVTSKYHPFPPRGLPMQASKMPPG